MATRTTAGKFSAAAATATVFGVLAGLGGITHGVGEVLQGNAPVRGLALHSWTSGPIATNLGGEPGISILPTTASAGVATLAFSAAALVWSVAHVRREHGGLILILLSSGMLFAGGGIGPPLTGILAGVAGLGGAGRQPRWVRRLPTGSRRALASAWPPLFALGVANGVFLVVGSVTLAYAADLNAPNLFLGSFYCSVVLLVLLLAAGVAYDAREGDVRAAREGSSAPLLKEA
jgi:hypothetical protein